MALRTTLRRAATAVIGLSTGLSLVVVPLVGSSSTAATAPTAIAGAAAPAAYTPPPIDFKKCTDERLIEAKAQCGMLIVPLDYADPTGPTIKLAVSRIAHTTSTSKGAVFTNPGGPGGSGLTLSRIGGAIPGKVGASFDWYGMDPRGVGSSKPALTCDGDILATDRPAYVPNRSGNLKQWRAITKKYAKACGSAKASRLLPHVKTTDTVADFESLRVAIGETKVSFYGFSYGTYIAQVYATLHPTSLDRVVMDGVVDASRAWYGANLDQDKAFERTFGVFERWVSQHDSTYHLGRTKAAVDAAYKKTLARVTRKPVGDVGAAVLSDVLLGAGYYVYGWDVTAQALADLANDGDPSGIEDLYGDQTGKGADNGYAMYLATECTEAPWPTDWKTWLSDTQRVAKKSPFLTWGNAWFNMPCKDWAVPSQAAFVVDGSKLTTPILLMAETKDAATPFSGALATRAEFPTASLIEGKGGTTHSSSLSGVGCVDNTIARYLATGVVPTRKSGDRSDKKCPALQPVEPGATARRAVLPTLTRPLF